MATRLTTQATQLVLYTVPAGETVIIKDVRISNRHASLFVGVELLWRIGAGFRTWYQANVPPQLINEPQDNPMWVVLPPGANVAVNTSAEAIVDLLISGTELAGVAT